jgi:hypothetical protein
MIHLDELLHLMTMMLHSYQYALVIVGIDLLWQQLDLPTVAAVSEAHSK